MNRVILIGRLGKDPEIKQTTGGKNVCKFTLATSYKPKDGDEKTQWHNVAAWGQLGKLCHEHLSKGREAAIEGRIEYHEYEKDGDKKYWTEIVAESVKFLGAKPKDGGGGKGDGKW